MASLLVRAPAKINLFLRVGRRRADGYHSLETLFHAIGLSDELRFSPSPRLSLAVRGMAAPHGAGNLVVRAALLLMRETGCRRGVRIVLEKRIPAGAGLGGGSSDAAAALAGLNRFWKLRLPASRLRVLGARLGSDVPFFLAGSAAAIGTGRGERLRPVRSRLRAWAAVVKPRFGIPTRGAYAALDRLPPSRRPRPTASLASCFRAVRSGRLRALIPHNDFEAAVFPARPRLARLKSSLLAAGASCAFMTGSGSAVVGLFASRPCARRAASLLGRRHRAWSACTRLL